MGKAGLICGCDMFWLVLLAASSLSPFCARCVPVPSGIVAGYLTGECARPTLSSKASKRGALAGLLASGIALAIEPGIVWGGQLAIACIVGLANILLSVALGFAGGAIWFASQGNKTSLSNLSML